MSKKISLMRLPGFPEADRLIFIMWLRRWSRAAQEFGLENETAKQLIIQTLLGAAEMLSVSGKEAKELRLAVTSPGGTTEAGIAVLRESGVEEAFIEGIKAAAAQSKKLGLMTCNPKHTV